MTAKAKGGTLYLARIVRGCAPHVYPVSEFEAFTYANGQGVIWKRRELGAWRHAGGKGASAIMTTPATAIASAKMALERTR